MKIRLLSRNPHKVSEACEILAPHGVEVIALKKSIDEIQTPNIEDIARDKCKKAFAIAGRPVVVEHTGLFISSLNGLPGGLTQIFWDTLQADRFTELFGSGSDTSVRAETVVAYCDTKRIRLFQGSIKGTIPQAPRGSRKFRWDCVFVPEGFDVTFAEMGKTKSDISMRKRALDKLADFLTGIA